MENNDFEYVENWEFDDEDDFLESVQHGDFGLQLHDLRVFLDMVTMMKDIVFDQGLYEPDMEKLENARGIFRWHLTRNGRSVWVFLIYHKVMYAGQHEPFDATLSLRLEAERDQRSTDPIRTRIVAEDNLNANEDGDFSIFFGNDRVLNPIDLFCLFEIWLKIPRNGKNVHQIKEMFMDEVGRLEFHQNSKHHFPMFLLKEKPHEQNEENVEGTKQITQGYPWIKELSPELIKMILRNGPTDLRSQSLYNYGPLG
jgi:hypothetical protein